MLRPIRLLTLLSLAVLAASAGFTAPAAQADSGAESAEQATVFRAPLNNGADPFMAVHDGMYHLMTTRGDRLTINSARSIAQLPAAADHDIWIGANDDPSRSTQIWAPALYRFDNPAGKPRWYVYYTASDGVDANHRMYVLESKGDDPRGPYHFKAQIADQGQYQIDGEPIVVGGQLYFTWSMAGRGFTGGPQQIYIQKMTNPWTSKGPVVELPVDIGTCPEVREGPTSIVRGDRLFLTYSSCDTGKPDYSLYMISIPTDGDPMVRGNWTTYPDPILKRNDAAGVYGPGHHSFFKSPDGTQDWIAYHAKNTSAYTYEWRTTRAQQVTWSDAGLPVIGEPVALGTDIEVPSGDPGPGPRAINDTDTGTGAFQVEYAGNWLSGSGCGNQCYRGDDHWSWEVGATATYRFTGTQLALFSVRDVGNGIAAISIDGGPETRHDYFSSPRQGQVMNYRTPKLPPGEHTVTVRVTGEKNPRSSSAVISIDRAEVWP